MTAVEYLKQLVGFESTSCFSNVPVIEYVEQRLRALGFETERIDYDDEDGVRKANVVGRRGAGEGGMAYFGHTDVVPAADWKFKDHGPFEATVKGDKLYGRGSCDMKGSVACALAAAEATPAGDQTKPLYMVCTADEEVGFQGAAEVAARSGLYRQAREGRARGIIGEPTRLEVVYAHKGAYGFKAVSHGRAAHSSTREGLNANLAMIPFLADLKTLYDETENSAAWQNAEFDPPTVCMNIGINDFTYATNIKAPQSVCTVYYRPMPGSDADGLMDRARAAGQKHGVEFIEVGRKPYVYTDPNSAFVTELLAQAGKGKGEARTVSYATDAVCFADFGELVVYGPGDIAQAHTHDEWIALEQLDAGTAAYTKLIRAWCC